jgi:hypothetical protein
LSLSMVSSTPAAFQKLTVILFDGNAIPQTRAFDKPPPTVLLIFDGHPAIYDDGRFTHSLEPIDAVSAGAML